MTGRGLRNSAIARQYVSDSRRINRMVAPRPATPLSTVGTIAHTGSRPTKNAQIMSTVTYLSLIHI